MKPQAFDTYRCANEILRGLGITYWLDCGTLLGAIRENDFIGHDTDIDFGVFTDRHEDIAGLMYEMGFEKCHFFGTPEVGYEQSFRREGVKVDIFYFYETPPPGGFERGALWQGSWWKKHHLIVSEFDQVVLEPQRAEFLGEWTYLPRDPEKLLEARYGDWRKPNKNWRWYRDPRCIRKDTLPPLQEMEALECKT
jgi:hypothetical protein